MRRNPGFAAAVLVTLGVGIGGTTAVFLEFGREYGEGQARDSAGPAPLILAVLECGHRAV